MSGYLDYTDKRYQKGYQEFYLNKEWAKDLVGKRICYVRKCDYEKVRDYVFPQYGKVEKVSYGQVVLEGGSSFYISEILEIAVKL